MHACDRNTRAHTLHSHIHTSSLDSFNAAIHSSERFSRFLMPLTSRNKPQQPTTGARYSSTVSVISATPNSSGHAADHRVFHSHDEWSDAKWSFILWCLLSATLAGLVDGASLSGVYREATSHLSGVSTKMALRLQDPPLALTTALASNLGYSLSFWDYLIIVCSFGLGSLICGFVLVDFGVQGSPEPLLLNVNLGSALNFQHRVVIALSALSLLLSSLIVYCMEHHICFFGSCHSPHAIFAQMFLSMTFASCACGLLNGLTSCSKTMIFRASHMTGTITDAFLLVGYYIRTGLFPRPHAVRFGVSSLPETQLGCIQM